MAEQSEELSAREPLPSIPDGGLATSMPVWLKQAPGRPIGEPAQTMVDMVSLAQSLELPPWLAALSERLDAGQARTTVPVETIVVVEAPADVQAIVVEAPDVPEADALPNHRPLGGGILAAQQHAADRTARPAKLTLPPIPAATPVDAEEFLRGGEITVVPEPRSKMPFIAAALLIIVLAAAAVWYLGA